MFHVKQRRLGLIGGLSLLGALAISCSYAATPRGWAEPVEEGNTIIVSTGRGRLDGIDADTNRGRWRFPNFWDIQNGDDKLSGIYGPPIVAADGDTTFVADYNGFVYAFKQSQALTAAQLQAGFPKPVAATLNLGEPVIGGLTVDPATNDLFVTSGARLLRLRYASDRLTADWVFETGADIWSEPVLASDGKVIFSSLDGGLYAVNQDNGSQVWKYSVGDSGLVSTPAIIDNVVYAGGFDSKLHAVDLATGEAKWAFQASHWVWNTPISEGPNLIFGDFNGRLYAVNASDGSESWRIDLGKGAIVGSPVIAQDTLVVATQDGWLTGIDPSTREIKWQNELDTSFTADLVVATDDSVLIAPRGCVTPDGLEQKVYYYAVDPRTGELRQAEDIC